ncbi:Protease 1 precursor [compost metagenome]
MKRFLFLWSLLLLSFAPSRAADSLRVLFIGNSMTYFNDMPYMFRSIAIEKGKPVSVQFYAPGGSGFVNHVSDPNVWSLFANTPWDVVVLQPGTSESAGASATVNETIGRGRQLLDSVYHYSPCARVFLYEIPYGVPSASAYNNYFSVQTMIRDSISKMADSLHVQMIPAGECARAYYALHQNLLLHGSYNDIHPSAYGSLMVAAAAYAAIFQDTVSGSAYHANLVADTAAKFYRIVDTVVLNHLADWRINTYNLHAAFSHASSGLSITFNSNVANATQVLWDFGDGQSSTTLNPVHVYSNPGTYTVSLTASGVNGCTEQVSQVLSVAGSTGIKGASSVYSVSIYPNPFDHRCMIHQDKLYYTQYELLNFAGQHILGGMISTPDHGLDLSGLPAGIYLLHLSGADWGHSLLRLMKRS